MAAKGAQQSKKGNKHATNTHRRERKHGHGPSKFTAKAGKRQRFTTPPKPNPENAKARAAGEQQFFSDGVPFVLREEHQLKSGDSYSTYTPVVGVYDPDRKRFIRHSSRRFT